MESTFVSLFENVGLPRQADAAQVQAALRQAAVTYGGPDRLPMLVQRAFRLLLNDDFRANYSRLLAAMSANMAVRIAPAERDTFWSTCREGGLQAAEQLDGSFVVFPL